MIEQKQNLETNYFFNVEKEWSRLSSEIFRSGLEDKLALLGIPTSCRDPESCEYFHAGAKRLSSFQKAFILFKSLTRFLRRWTFRHFGSFEYVKRDESSVLALSPTTVCKVMNGKVSTSYLASDDVEAVSWILFSEAGSMNGEKWYLSRLEVLNLFVRFVVLFLRTEDRDGEHCQEGMFLNWKWLLGGYWFHLVSLEKVLEKILTENAYKKVHCVHEFHAHSRILWAIARKYELTSSTICHAPMEREKLWLFPTRKEQQNGLIFPSEMTLYCEEDRKLLGSVADLSQTEIFLGSSPRFQIWKKVQPFSKGSGASFLFVSSIANWDNHVVLNALFKFSEEAKDLSILFRPHPDAIIWSEDQEKLDQLVQAKKVHFSSGKLMDSIKESQVVIGMCTSVLDEALLLGKPAINLKSDNFTSLGSSLAFAINSNHFNFKEVLDSKALYEENRENYILKARHKLGLDLKTKHIYGENYV